MFLFCLFSLSLASEETEATILHHRIIPLCLAISALLVFSAPPPPLGLASQKKLHPTSHLAVLTNSLSKGYHNFLACCDFGDPTHNSLHSIHPYFELHGSPDHPRAMNANQSSHSCSYTRDNAADFLQQLEQRKILVFRAKNHQFEKLTILL